MAHDYKVDFRSEDTLARRADRLRKQARRTGKYTIDIIDLIERVLKGHFADKGGLKIDFFIRRIGDEPAYVTYGPLTLHVDRTVWADAKKGYAYAYFILAHEIGHLLFHDHRAVAFSNDPEDRLKSFMNENSAEWQADTFAKHLTIPDRILLQHSDADVIAIICNVDRNVVEERLESYGRTGPMIRTSYEGDACAECGNFSMARDGDCLRCDTCGNTAR